MSDDRLVEISAWLLDRGFDQTLQFGRSVTFQRRDGLVTVKVLIDGENLGIEVWTPDSMRVGVPVREVTDPDLAWLDTNVPVHKG